MPKLKDVLTQLIERSDENRGRYQNTHLGHGLTVTYYIAPQGQIHRLAISRHGTYPSDREWATVLANMPYSLSVEFERIVKGPIHWLRASFLAKKCEICGAWRHITHDDMLEDCKTCGDRVKYAYTG